MERKVSLERAISKLGFATRTKARAWIQSGKVRVNGCVHRDPNFKVTIKKDRVEVEGREITQAPRRLFLLYKPRGVVTTHSDPEGRPTVFSLMGEKSTHLIAVGRLDWASTGLLLLTNDTELSHFLTDPGSGIKRVYLVTVRGLVTEEKLARLAKGIHDRGENLKADRILLRKKSRKESHLTVTLTEGKNREIRRLFSSEGHEVTRLKRVSYGPFTLGDLKPGESREISQEEVTALSSSTA